MAETRGVALVTGGGSGIGLATALALAREGMDVALAGRNADKLRQAAAQCAALGVRTYVRSVDISCRAHVRDLVGAVHASLGRLDVLVNSAGVGSRRETSTIAACADAEWDRTLDTNLRGAFLCIQQALPIMTAQGGGYIFNISSRLAKAPSAGVAAYAASKAGLVALTQSILAEAALYNIRATAICPAAVATPMMEGSPLRREDMLSAEDIAACITTLLRLSPGAVIREIVIERASSLRP